MNILLIKLLSIAYACVGIISLLAYWPTIRDLSHHKKPSANISSFSLWTITSGITLLYSIFILPDLLFRLVSGLNFFACSIVLILSLKLKSEN